MKIRSRSFLPVLTLASAAVFSANVRDAHSQPAPSASAAPSPEAAPAAETADVVKKVQAFYDKTTTFKAEFTQEFFVKAYNKKKASKGRVTFSKPGKMDFAYDDPKDNRVVSDGSLLRVYEAENKQVYEQTMDKSQYPAALTFLTGQGKLADHFQFEGYRGAAMNFPGGFVLLGTPKAANPAFEKVLFYIDSATYQVRRVVVVDAQGNRNRFDFINPKINEAVPENQFKFTPPPGTTTVRP